MTATLKRQAGEMNDAPQGYSSLPLRALLSMLPNTAEITAALEKALAELRQRRV